jgi:hypothetical protein
LKRHRIVTLRRLDTVRVTPCLRSASTGYPLEEKANTVSGCGTKETVSSSARGSAYWGCADACGRGPEMATHKPLLARPPHRVFGCFSLLILKDRAASSYQLLDLSLAGLPLDRLFLIGDLLSFEVGVLILSFLGNCLPLSTRSDSTSH